MVVRVWRGSEPCTAVADVDRVLCEHGISLKIRHNLDDRWIWKELSYPKDYEDFSVNYE